MAIAEVVSSTASSVVAQCLPSNHQKSQQIPRFGSFIRIESSERDLSTIAVVNNVVTAPIDNVHRTSAFGLSREELRIQQPQIFSLLRTDIHACLIGFKNKEQSFRYLPPYPPEIHDFVYCASISDIDTCTKDFDFLRLLSSLSDGPLDELLAAAVREAYLAKDSDKKFLLQAGQSLSQLYRGDYDRLVSILRKINPS